MTRTLTLSLLLICAWSGVADAQPAPSFQFSFHQPFGKYAVGLKVVQQYDLDRPFSLPDGRQPNLKRPLQTLVWYPAIHRQTSPMVLGDFENLIAHETSFDEASLRGSSQDFVHAFMQGTEAERTMSVRDATPEQQLFPVIVYAPSLNAPNFENIELCEYLASNGFVVLASPSIGASTRHMQVDAADAAGQTADILFLLKFAKTLPDADLGKVAVVGYSLGGTAALLAVAADSHISAFVALDGSFRYEPPPNVAVGKITIPLLFFSRGETPLAPSAVSDSPLKQDPRVLNDWIHGDLFQIRVLGISHIQFSTLYQRSERFKREGMQFVPATYSLADGDESYGWIARYTLDFLKANLMHDQSAKAFLMRSPSDNGVPSRLMVTSFRPATQK